MRGLQKVESSKDRKAFARDAGMGPISLLGILAGTLVAFASFAVLLAIVGGILAAVGIDTATLTANDYERLGIGSAVVAALVLFVSYFFGGYIAGRLARRSGALNGGLVLVLAIVIGAVVAAIVGTQADTQAAADRLRVIGVPTSGSDYSGIATVAGIVTLLAMIAGSVLGGIKGERWHGKLAARAFDPGVGREARARQEMAEAEHRRTQDYHRPEPAPATATESTPAQGGDDDRARNQEPAAQQTAPQPVAGPSREQQAVPAPGPDGSPQSRWSEEESRAWGAPRSESQTGGQAEGAQPSGPQDHGDVLTQERSNRPRRERPLRSGRRT